MEKVIFNSLCKIVNYLLKMWYGEGNFIYDMYCSFKMFNFIMNFNVSKEPGP